MDNWGPGKPRRRTSAANWKKPVLWNRAGVICPECNTPGRPDCACGQMGAVGRTVRPRVFPSLCDWLDEEVPIEWLADFLKLIHDTPNLDWLLLTKRPENWRDRLEAVIKSKTDGTGKDGEFWQWMVNWLGGIAPANVWPGASVEDQPRADERIPKLLSIPAKVRFLSCEPLLGPVDLKLTEAETENHDSATLRQGLDWAIIGGESGPGARTCNVEWVRSLVSQCRAAGVAPFVKQLGSNPIMPCKPEGTDAVADLRDKKGGDPTEWPEDLRVREFPKT